jgi:hypothetical protein
MALAFLGVLTSVLQTPRVNVLTESADAEGFRRNFGACSNCPIANKQTRHGQPLQFTSVGRRLRVITHHAVRRHFKLPRAGLLTFQGKNKLDRGGKDSEIGLS